MKRFISMALLLVALIAPMPLLASGVSGGSSGGTDTNHYTLSGTTQTSANPSASTTYILNNLTLQIDATVWDVISGVPVPVASTLVASKATIWCNAGTGDSTHAVTFKTYKMASASVTTSTGGSANIATITGRNDFSETGLSISYAAGDLVGWQIVVPASWTGPSQCWMTASSTFTVP